jgi:hypothetical protein
MIATQWLVEGDAQDAIYELQGRRFGSGDQGGPMLCSVLCAQQGRHAHVDYCRTMAGSHCAPGPEYQHITTRLLPNPTTPKDWVSHKLYWGRSGESTHGIV